MSLTMNLFTYVILHITITVSIIYTAPASSRTNHPPKYAHYIFVNSLKIPLTLPPNVI